MVAEKPMGIGKTSMNICIFGLWHLGIVTAACLASSGFKVSGLDLDHSTIETLKQGVPPIFEPGLEELLKKGMDQGKLNFTSDLKTSLSDVDLVWVTFDTPVDDQDIADTEWVIEKIKSLFPFLPENIMVLVSSQLPVGSISQLEMAFQEQFPIKKVSFAYCPENLRLGKAIEVFMNQERIIIGVRDSQSRKLLSNILASFTNQIEWMSVESAEMTKHALNAFLATSVAFINEIAKICEETGADACEVERGLKSEPRIGPKAYLKAGGAFAGGTLARDIHFLNDLALRKGINAHLLNSVRISNSEHKSWMNKKLISVCGVLKGKSIAVLGLTYKPGTDTLRRSASIELCRWLVGEGAKVKAFDPIIRKLPEDYKNFITLTDSPESALQGAHAAIVTNELEDFKNLKADVFISLMIVPIILDQNRFLEKNLDNNALINYVAVGKPS
jgi:UDPglucose 6-dehydrogenase